MAPMPAPNPAAMSVRRCRVDSPSQPATVDPRPAPIWAIGPSRPADPPVPMVMAAVMAFTKGTRARILPSRK